MMSLNTLELNDSSIPCISPISFTYSALLSSDASLLVSHTSAAASVKESIYLSFVLGFFIFCWCRYNPKYHRTDAMCAQQPTTPAPDLHVKNEPVMGFKPVLYFIHNLYVLLVVYLGLI